MMTFEEFRDEAKRLVVANTCAYDGAIKPEHVFFHRFTHPGCDDKIYHILAWISLGKPNRSSFAESKRFEILYDGKKIEFSVYTVEGTAVMYEEEQLEKLTAESVAVMPEF